MLLEGKVSALQSSHSPTAAESVAAAISDVLVFGPLSKEKKIHFPMVTPVPIFHESAAPLRSRRSNEESRGPVPKGLCGAVRWGGVGWGWGFTGSGRLGYLLQPYCCVWFQHPLDTLPGVSVIYSSWRTCFMLSTLI